MARQPRRSALALAINQQLQQRSLTATRGNSRSYTCSSTSSSHWRWFLLSFVVLSMAGIFQGSDAYDSPSLSTELYSSTKIAVGSGSPDPKFGERLLPRNRQIIGAYSISNNFKSLVAGRGNSTSDTSLTTTRSTTTTSVNRNNLLNNSNYVIINSKKSVVGASGQHVSIKSTIDEDYPLGEDSNNIKGSLKMSLILARTKNPVISKSRQGKQLHRRNDDNVNDSSGIQASIVDGDSNSENVMAHLAVSETNVSKADRLEMSTEFFLVPSTTTTTSTTAGPPRTPGKARGQLSGPAIVHQQPNKLGHGPRPVLILAPKSTTTNASAIPSLNHPQIGLRKEPWVVPVLVLASLSMIMMAAFEIFVLFKAWRTSPSRRHLFLGQMLLLGLFACAGLGAIITAHPTLFSCGMIRFGVGVAYALVFAALLVKCVFLISLNGGVYLPAPYQGLLLLFAVLIQVAIGAQWLMTQPPEIYTMNVPVGGGFMAAATSTTSSGAISPLFHEMKYTSSSSSSSSSIAAVSASELITRSAPTMLIPLCKTQFSELLFSLIYIVFLIVFVAVLAIKSRGIRDNYREATYIGLAIGGAIPIWLGWMLCGLAVADRHKDACIAFGLVATSATVFLVMFMPKGRQLAAMGKEGLYVEDREEQFSSLSRAGSGYSPSFFHFKPIKYGVMGAMPNSTSNTGNANSMKHCSNALNGGGLFIRSDETNLYTTLEPTLSSNPNVYFQRGGGVHPGMMY